MTSFHGSVFRRRPALAIALATTLAASPVAAQTVANGSFETPDIAAGTFQYNPTAAFESNAGVAANGSIFLFASAPDGDQVAFLQSAPSGTGAFSLDVSGLTAGTSYTASFLAARRPDVDGFYGVNPFTVSFNGVLLGTFTPASTQFAAFTTTSFVAGGTTGTLRFVGTPVFMAGADNASAIDLVSVSPVATSAVPEPASWAMMIGGFGVIGGTMRRRGKRIVQLA